MNASLGAVLAWLGGDVHAVNPAREVCKVIRTHHGSVLSGTRKVEVHLIKDRVILGKGVDIVVDLG
jgi:hypothetical protein